MSEKQELAENMEKTQARLLRAAKLTTGLADEQVRWADSVKVHYCKYFAAGCLITGLIEI